jgi:2,3-bisphosphoglycerate-independent phosphoglycerate mutase
VFLFFETQIVNALSVAIHNKLTQHPINEARAKEGKDLANLILLRGCGGLYDVCTSLIPFISARAMLLK